MAERITLEDRKIVDSLREEGLTYADIAHRCDWTAVHVMHIKSVPIEMLE